MDGRVIMSWTGEQNQNDWKVSLLGRMSSSGNVVGSFHSASDYSFLIFRCVIITEKLNYGLGSMNHSWVIYNLPPQKTNEFLLGCIYYIEIILARLGYRMSCGWIPGASWSLTICSNKKCSLSSIAPNPQLPSSWKRWLLV